MKKILLIGDSIRNQYNAYVKKALEDVAEVYTHEDSARFTTHTLRSLYNWVQNGNLPEDMDVVHWNVSLWDIMRLYGDDTPLTPLDTYALNIKRIDKALRIFFPKAKFIFATCTAVREELFKEWWYTRRNADAIAYSKVAVEALKNTDTVINDLTTHTQNLDVSYYCDNTHFSEDKGVPYIARKVLDVICEVANIDKSKIKNADGTAVRKQEASVFGV